ncbi:MAG TPA: hypothetical protein VLW45_01180 [Pelomicrobium sp.]|nr:hypothetical protein [Pelomicrobium sp.]
MNNTRRSGRRWFVLAAVCIAAFAVNVGLRMLHIKQGITIWRLDDVGEFLLVLIGMVFFVAGLLCVEEPAESSTSIDRIDPKGGES